VHQPKTRVLVVYHHLPHYRYDVFRRLEEDPTLEVEFAAAPQSQDGSIPTIPATALRRFVPLRNVWFGPLLWQVGLLRLLARRRHDVVIFLGVCSYLSSWVGAVLTRVLGGAVLHWTIGWHRPDRGLRRLFRLTFYRLASKLLVYGNVGRDIGIAMGYPADRMTVIYNSSSGPIEADGAALGPADFTARLPPVGRQVVGAVIRLNPVKQLDLLIRAVALLRGAGRPVEVLLVGEGPEQQALMDLAAELGVPLWLPGAAYGDAELAQVYERCLVTVVPSAAGLTVLQSLRFGRPVVTHDNMYEQVPECEAIVPGVTGELYLFGDLESLRSAIARWLDRQLSNPDGTARACRAALDAAWNADVQSRIIAAEVRAAARRRSGLPVAAQSDELSRGTSR
jgi:glycosyltransferase involved in cell wall biosynthesis